jgi:hypothetical protein
VAWRLYRFGVEWAKTTGIGCYRFSVDQVDCG